MLTRIFCALGCIHMLSADPVFIALRIRHLNYVTRRRP